MTNVNHVSSTGQILPRIICPGLLSIAIVLGLARDSLAETPIATDSGLVSGAVTQDGIRVFKGIPFAAPPVGENRWRPPQPVKQWSEVRACNEFGSACPQSDILVRRYGITLPPMSEDCLHLDIYAPPVRKDQEYPVMVWIHGGGFSTGHSSSYNGEYLAQQGAIVVTINYRVGVFGFLPHAQLSAESEHQSSGNYGLLDMVAALKWVQRNIEGFGGAPNNVTIFGQSSGGTAVCTLMTSPLASGLFHRAIVQSGGAFDVLPDLASAEAQGARLFQAMEASEDPDPLATLRSKDWQEILSSAQAARLRYSAILDGWCVPAQPIQAFLAGEQTNVPSLIGSNANESDEEFTVAARFFAREHSKLNAQTYRYFFSQGSKEPNARGPIHAAEIDYVFNTPERRERSIFDSLDRNLASTMSGMWVEFARTGDPNPPTGSRVWPPYDAATDPYIEFSTTVSTGTGLRTEICDSIDKLTQQELGKHQDVGHPQ